MGATGISSMKLPRKNSLRFMAALSSAACEWFLMFLIFLDAALSYVLRRFAYYCELQTPCILCSRLDHIFAHEKPGCYRSLLCSNHREEISSSVSCQIHDKLADVRGMCEECFMSIAMQNKSSSESYKLMMGKLGVDFERCGFQSPYRKKNFISPSSTRICSCCNKPVRTKTNAQRLLQLTPAGFGASRANVRPPLPRVPGRSRLSHRDSLKRIRDKLSGTVTSPRSGSTADRTLSHVGYSELRITSDSESEVPFSDDDDRSSVNREKIDSDEFFLAQGGSENLAKAQTDRATLMKHVRPSLLDESLQPNVNKSNDAFIGRDSGELNREQPNSKLVIPSAIPELISLDDVPSSSNVMEIPFGVSELISLNVTPPNSTATEVPLGVPEEKGEAVKVTVISESGDTSVTKSVIFSESTGDKTQAGFPNEAIPSMSNDSVKIDKIVKLTPAQHDELRKSDASSSDGVRVFQSSDRNDSGYESPDRSSVSEIEGENIVDRLKRQVDYDRKCLTSSYKELEEERSASAIAANQAMAMITRLQEEKAALRMESLQYLRMMEEQAEYDMDALEKANDLLAEKEKEIHDLEEELDFYRNNFPDESAAENLPQENSDQKAEKETFGSDSKSAKISEEKEKSNDVKPSFSFDFEDETMYITKCLKNLEKKLYQVSSDWSSEKISNGVENPEGIYTDGETQIYDQNGKNGLSLQKDASPSNGSPCGHDSAVGSVEDIHFVNEERSNHFDFDRQKSSMQSGEIDLVTLENEVLDLNSRLEALEADRDFLEHAFNTVQNGKEGLPFLQVIAHQLQEIRKVEFSRCRCLTMS